MRFTIHKGRHRAWPIQLRLWFDKTIIRKRVIFDRGCRYDLNSIDQYDSNKLFGIGYFWSHHQDSARFGWWYNKEQGKITITAYCYVNGQRIIKDLCQVQIGFQYEFTIEVNPGWYTFRVKNPSNGMVLAEIDTGFNHKKKWAFHLGLYFGGNMKAPQTMIIEIKKT